MSHHHTKPIWQQGIQFPQFESLSERGHFDAVIVGGGITGLSAALMLKLAGKKVCVLERNRIGQGETAHTTAHLTCVTDTRLLKLVNTFGRERAARAWYAGIAAIDTIEQLINEFGIECEFHRTPGYFHASLDGTEDETNTLRSEAKLAQDLGFNAEFVEHVPVVNKPGFCIHDQAKFHPLEYLAGLARLIPGEGSAIFEQTDVSEVRTEPLTVMANELPVHCKYVVIATHVPLMGKTGLVKATFQQSMLMSYLSYVIGGSLPKGVSPDLSLWDTSDPYYYLRVDAGLERDRVIFGGKDHKTGQAADTDSRFRELEEKLMRILPQTTIDSHWSGQIIDTPDGLPFIGESTARQFIATGYNGNGITFATLAGIMARDAMLQRENPWEELFSVNRRKLKAGAWRYVKNAMDYPYYLVADRVAAPTKVDPTSLRIGEGKVLKLNGKNVACSRDERGELLQVSAVCPHMGCLVHWNNAEATWDCPCHGSRFAQTGELIAGPAESPLAKIAGVEAASAEKAGSSQ